MSGISRWKVSGRRWYENLIAQQIQWDTVSNAGLEGQVFWLDIKQFPDFRYAGKNISLYLVWQSDGWHTNLINIYI